MKSKEEILDKYSKHGADGMPEITAGSLLKAMEEYRLQAEEAAFNASRQMNGHHYIHNNFTSYKAGLKTDLLPQPNETDRIKMIADTVVEQFLPTNPATQHFSFDFKTDGKSYTAHYTRNAGGQWEYESFV